MFNQTVIYSLSAILNRPLNRLSKLRNLKNEDDRPFNDVVESTELPFTSVSTSTEKQTSSKPLSSLSFAKLKGEQQTSCTVKTNWDRFLPYTSITTNLTHWNYTETTRCTYVNVLDTKHIETMHDFSFDCSDKYSPSGFTTRYGKNRAKVNKDIQAVDFGDECLLRFIETCCYDSLSVPNVVHYVWYQKIRFTFFEYVSIYSVIRFVRPCAILIHGDRLPVGVYWDHIRTIFPNIIHVKRNPPSTVGGKDLGFPEHAGDIMRIEALIQYGGIYLDLDTVFVKPIDELRAFPYTMSAQSSGFISSAFISSERNSTFVYRWFQGYLKKYVSTSYTFNAMTYPRFLSNNFPDEIHVLKGNLSRPWYQIGRVVYITNYDWRSIYGIHLFTRGFNRPMNEKILKTFNSTIGSICRHILYGNKELCR